MFWCLLVCSNVCCLSRLCRNFWTGAQWCHGNGWIAQNDSCLHDPALPHLTHSAFTMKFKPFFYPSLSPFFSPLSSLPSHPCHPHQIALLVIYFIKMVSLYGCQRASCLLGVSFMTLSLNLWRKKYLNNTISFCSSGVWRIWETSRKWSLANVKDVVDHDERNMAATSPGTPASFSSRCLRRNNNEKFQIEVQLQVKT